MEGVRKEKISVLIKKLASSFFLREIGLPGVLISVSRVDLSDNLQNVKIFFSIFPEEKDRMAWKQIYSVKRSFKRFLTKNLKIKYIPKIMFLPDESLEKQRRIEDLLNDLK